MRAKTYAQAITELLRDPGSKGREEHIIKRAVEVAIQNGHRSLLPKIARSVEKMEDEHARRRIVIVSAPGKLSERERMEALSNAYIDPRSPVSELCIEEREDDTLIGGTVVTTRSLRVDQSVKRTLEDLYERITAQ